MSRPLLIRPGTPDQRVFRHVYIEETYALDGPPPDIVLDLGAHTGVSTRWLMDRHPGARMIAVEPNPGVIPLLRLNAPGAEIHPVAVSGEAGTGRLALYPDDDWRATLHSDGDGGQHVTVPVRTVDDVLDGRMPDLVKIDVEGAEREIFRAGGRWLKGARVIWLETHDRFVAGCSAAVRAALAACDRSHVIKRRGGEDLTIRFGGSGR